MRVSFAVSERFYVQQTDTFLCTLLVQTVIDDNYNLDVLGFKYYAFTKPHQSCDSLVEVITVIQCLTLRGNFVKIVRLWQVLRGGRQ